MKSFVHILRSATRSVGAICASLICACICHLTGCVAYPTNGGDHDTFSFGEGVPKRKLSCCVVHQLDVQKVPQPFGLPPASIVLGTLRGDSLLAIQKDVFMEELQKSEAFASCIEGSGAVKAESDISIRSECRFTWSENVGTVVFNVLSLTLIPTCYHNYYFNYSFVVSRRDGLTRQYRFKEQIKDRFGVLMLLASPFMESTSHGEAFDRINRSVMCGLLGRMNKDGFFADNFSQTVLKSRNEDRLKELKQMLDAGIISEEEYRRESGKIVEARGETISEYVVKAGDTLLSIAEQHGMTVRQLKDMNQLKSDFLMVGQRLKLRGETK